MQHPGFFQREGPYPLKVIAEATGAELLHLCDGEKEIDDLRPLHQAAGTHLTFCASRKYAGQLAATHAAACLIKRRDAELVPEGAAAVTTDAPHRAFAIAVGLLYPEALQPTATGAAANATGQLIHPTAQIAEGVRIEPGAVIGREARIGAGTTIAAGAVVGYRVYIGAHCYIGPGAAVTHALIGDRVILHAGVRIGQDGFGYAMSADGHLKVPQVGRVIIGDRVEIGANSTIDRGFLTDTVIGEGTKIDNLVQIAHNVVIGRHCVIIAQIGHRRLGAARRFRHHGRAIRHRRTRQDRRRSADCRHGACEERRRGRRPHGWNAGAPLQGMGPGSRGGETAR